MLRIPASPSGWWCILKHTKLVGHLSACLPVHPPFGGWPRRVALPVLCGIPLHKSATVCTALPVQVARQNVGIFGPTEQICTGCAGCHDRKVSRKSVTRLRSVCAYNTIRRAGTRSLSLTHWTAVLLHPREGLFSSRLPLVARRCCCTDPAPDFDGRSTGAILRFA